MAVKAVLIDLDDTLYDAKKCNEFAIEHTIGELSSIFNRPKEAVKELFDSSREKVKFWLGNTASSHSKFLYIQKTIEALKGKTDVKLTQNVHNLYWDVYFNQMTLSEGAIEFFNYLKENEVKIAVVTDLTVEIQFKKLIKLGVDEYVDFVITSEEAGKDKPAEPIFSLALEKLGCSKEEVVLIGDELKDMQGAENFGIGYIAVKDGNFRNVIESFKALK